MNFGDRFVSTAGQVGLLAQVTEFFLLMAVFAFAGSFLFSLLTRTSIAPEHRVSNTLTAIISLVAGASYFLIHDNYHEMLRELAKLPDEASRFVFVQQAYLAIGGYRYIDWSVTTPLLLLKTVLMLKVKPREIKGMIALLLAADVLMILTGYIGAQQVDAQMSVLVGPRLTWGTISTLFYLVIPVILYRIWQRYQSRGTPDEQYAYKLMALTSVTTWGVYPLGYLVPALLPQVNLNWVHIAFTIADIVNKVGVGLVAYQVSAKVLEQRVPEDATASVRLVE